MLSTEIGHFIKGCLSNEVDISVMKYLARDGINAINSDPSIESYLSRDGGLSLEGWLSKEEDDHAIEDGIITIMITWCLTPP